MTSHLKRIAVLGTICLLGALPLSGCNLTKNDEETLTIVTTVYPSYDFALQLTEQFDLSCDVKLLLTPGGESHSYEPTPSDVAAIQTCDMFIYIGGASETWVEYLLESTRKEKVNLRLMDYVTPIAAAHNHEQDHEDKHEHHEKHEADLAEYDEHIWTSPLNAAAMVRAIAAQLCSISPENQETCKTNEDALCNTLQTLDAAYRSAAESAGSKPLIFGDRFPFLYLAEEYGFSYAAAFSGCSSDTDASSATLSALISTVKEQQIDTIFYLENSPRKIADAICEATGAQAKLLHSCNNVSKEDFSSGKHFQEYLQDNLIAIKEALN
ncbi:MAG: zinc ABC transporter substrate-binding protein [Oscillospiraceae bacterium]|nr:zinc ABC transporter substrate-binding protein [Oscillospiraceae bacterium]